MALGIYPTSNVSTPSIASGATALAANTKRIGWMIQNLGTNPLFILLGSGASTSVFHAVLKGGTINDDGLGGSFAMSTGTVFTGVVTIAGLSPRYTTLEMAPG